MNSDHNLSDNEDTFIPMHKVWRYPLVTYFMHQLPLDKHIAHVSHGQEKLDVFQGQGKVREFYLCQHVRTLV